MTLDDCLDKDILNPEQLYEEEFNKRNLSNERYRKGWLGLRLANLHSKKTDTSEDGIDTSQSAHTSRGIRYNKWVRPNSILAKITGWNQHMRKRAKIQFRKAFKNMRVGWEDHPETSDALLHYVNLAGKKELQDIRDSVQRIVLNESSNSDIYFALGKIDRRSGNLEDALDSYDTSIELDQSNISALIDLADTHATYATRFSTNEEELNIKYTEIVRSVHAYELALNELSKGDDEKTAKDVIERLIRLYPDEKELRKKGARYLDNLGYGVDNALQEIMRNPRDGAENAPRPAPRVNYRTQRIDNPLGALDNIRSVGMRGRVNNELDELFNLATQKWRNRKYTAAIRDYNRVLNYFVAHPENVDVNRNIIGNVLHNISQIYSIGLKDDLNAAIHIMRAANIYPNNEIENVKKDKLNKLFS